LLTRTGREVAQGPDHLRGLACEAGQPLWPDHDDSDDGKHRQLHRPDTEHALSSAASQPPTGAGQANRPAPG
jgi:hypothetical protein